MNRIRRDRERLILDFDVLQIENDFRSCPVNHDGIHGRE